MVGEVVEREFEKMKLGQSESQISSSLNGSVLDGRVTQTQSNVTLSEEDVQRIGIAVSLSLMVGIIQVRFCYLINNAGEFKLALGSD